MEHEHSVKRERGPYVVGGIEQCPTSPQQSRLFQESRASSPPEPCKRLVEHHEARIGSEHGPRQPDPLPSASRNQTAALPEVCLQAVGQPPEQLLKAGGVDDRRQERLWVPRRAIPQVVEEGTVPNVDPGFNPHGLSPQSGYRFVIERRAIHPDVARRRPTPTHEETEQRGLSRSRHANDGRVTTSLD